MRDAIRCACYGVMALVIVTIVVVMIGAFFSISPWLGGGAIAFFAAFVGFLVLEATEGRE